MHDCVVKLLKNHDEESLECLCRLLTTIGKDLDFEKAKVGQDRERETRLAGQGWKTGCGVVLFEDLFFSSGIYVRHEEIIHSFVDVSSPPGPAPFSKRFCIILNSVLQLLLVSKYFVQANTLKALHVSYWFLFPNRIYLVCSF